MDALARTVALIDDEPSLLKMMATYLSRRGYTVLTFETTEEALERIDADPAAIGVAVIDLTISGVSATELARRLLVANSKARVILASGYPADTSELNALAPRRVVFLHKPFTPEMLLECVRGMLS
jgi:DNA-binding NtrC family response regulator